MSPLNVYLNERCLRQEIDYKLRYPRRQFDFGGIKYPRPSSIKEWS